MVYTSLVSASASVQGNSSDFSISNITIGEVLHEASPPVQDTPKEVKKDIPKRVAPVATPKAVQKTQTPPQQLHEVAPVEEVQKSEEKVDSPASIDASLLKADIGQIVIYEAPQKKIHPEIKPLPEDHLKHSAYENTNDISAFVVTLIVCIGAGLIALCYTANTAQLKE